MSGQAYNLGIGRTSCEVPADPLELPLPLRPSRFVDMLPTPFYYALPSQRGYT